MRLVLLIVGAMVATACGGKDQPAESPSNDTSSSTASSNDGSRRLSKSECEALASSIVDACNNRGNDRSAEADGWCSDMVAKNSGDGTWVSGDCVPHFRYMDRFCFEGAKNAHAMMTCDKTVDRVQ